MLCGVTAQVLNYLGVCNNYVGGNFGHHIIQQGK